MGDSQMVPMEYCHKTFSNGQCQKGDKYSLLISIDNVTTDNVTTVNFNGGLLVPLEYCHKCCHCDEYSLLVSMH